MEKTEEINRRYCPTGGGAQLKHIKQLVEIHYRDGYKNRISNEHLAGDSDEEFSSPLYATAVGLVNGIENQKAKCS
jgi:cell division protein FtsA